MIRLSHGLAFVAGVIVTVWLVALADLARQFPDPQPSGVRDASATLAEGTYE